MFHKVARVGTAVLLLLALWPNVPRVQGILDSCTVNVDVHLITQSSQTRFAFTFDTVVNFERISISRPSDDLTINGATGESWNTSYSPEEAVFIRGGSASNVVYVDALSGTNDVSLPDWVITASDDPGGADAIGCSGDLGIEIAGEPPASDENAPIISSITVTNITTSTVTVSWLTDEPAHTQINYGIDEFDDSFASDSLATTHTVNLEGLEPGSVYYYYLTARDIDSNEGSTTTNTFTTKSLTPNNQAGDLTTQPSPTASDSEPPVIQLDAVRGVFQSPPTFSGVATDNLSVAVVEYSVDGGKNWLPAESTTGLGSSSVRFGFSPLNLEDGDYQILARAKDNANNSSVSAVQDIVIDVLDPLIGGFVIYMGGQQLHPNAQGAVQGVANTELQLNLSAIGGANSVTVRAQQKDSPGDEAAFSLVDNVSNRLWQGTMKFEKAGTYSLTAVSTDGGGNTSSRALGMITIQAPAKITHKGAAVEKATVSVFYQDVETKTWSLWDAPAYSQANPLQTDTTGEYGFFLPAGTYYLKIRAAGYREVLSSIFTLNQPQVVGADIALKQRPGFSIGGVHIRLPWPSFSPTLNLASPIAEQATTDIDATLPAFTLPSTAGSSVSSVSILGKPTVLALVSTWSATARQQITTLDSITADQVNIVAVSSGESLGRLSSYARLSGYEKGLVADSENALINGLPNGMLPTLYFIDRQGTIKSMSSKVLSEQEIINNVPL